MEDFDNYSLEELEQMLYVEERKAAVFKIKQNVQKVLL